ncbi:pheromone precursor gene 1 protein [Podospora didyma]|uniref:Pheromone gene 1 protein n=1 Tax=Podospora didyma TaxID=330526 RepID=A0AAE0P543_9PEZI|nr:pheromone precursor gene 1 protein [Podospora didyma]
MKFSLLITVLAAMAVVDAAAVQDEKRWCQSEGQACAVVKRAADAFVDSFKTHGPVARDDSTASREAKRSAEQLAVVFATSAEDAEDFYASLGIPKTGKDSKVKREAEAAPWCRLFPGQACWKAKREANPEPWCRLFPGQACWKVKREAEAEPAEVQARCESEGGACLMAKRAAEAVLNSIESHAVKREAEPWCRLFPGQACWKREAEAEAACNSINGACTKATRDIHAIVNAARSIVEAN